MKAREAARSPSSFVSLLSLAAIVVVVGMPLRLGWRFIGPVAPHKFDAKMGDAEGFRRAGFSDDA